MRTAGEICRKDVVVAGRDETVLEAARRMRDEHVGSVVVVDRPDHTRPRPIGVLTDRDIVVGVLARTTRDLESVLVGDVMSTDPVTVSHREDLEGVLKRMRSAGVRRLPVVDGGGCLVGIVVLDDVIGLLQEQLLDLTTLLSNEMRRERSERA